MPQNTDKFELMMDGSCEPGNLNATLKAEAGIASYVYSGLKQ